MKLLPILINDCTDYMIDFESEQSYQESFVVAAQTEGILFSLNTEKDKGIIFQTEQDEKYLHISEIGLRREQGNEEGNFFDRGFTCLDISLSEGKPATAVSEINGAENSGLNYIEENIIKYDSRHDLLKLKVTIKLNWNSNTIDRSFLIYLAPDKQIYNVVLDCGSEASQMAAFQKRRGEKFGINNRLSIMTSIMTNFNFTDADRYKHFVQAEVDDDGGIPDEKLYKSVFFAKKSIKEDDLKNVLPEIDAKGYQDDSTSFLRMCVDKNDLEGLKESYLQLYNMKIAGFGGISHPNVNFDGTTMSIREFEPDFQRRYISQFVYCSLNDYRVRWKLRGKEDEYPRVFQLNVLVPNIYSYEKTQDFISMIYKDIIEMVDNKNNGFKDKVLGVSVNAISESDASLVGAISIRGRDKFPNGVYLVVDAGKGTLDFSLAKYEDGKLENIMKSGIVGASAAISYGFLLDLLTAFKERRDNGVVVTDEILREFIHENILGLTDSGIEHGGGDMCSLNELMKVVDIYKKKYTSISENVVPIQDEEITENNTDAVNQLRVFTDWIRKCSFKVRTENVDAIINTIVNSVSQKLMPYCNLQDCSPNYVVFAGRGFLYAPFKEKMEHMLKGMYNKLEEKYFVTDDNGATNKNICLFVTDFINQGCYNGQRLPTPIGIDKNLLEDLKKHDKGNSNEGEGTDGTRTVNQSQTILQKLDNVFKNSNVERGKRSNATTNATTNQQDQNSSHHTMSADELFVKGFKIPIKNGTTIIIGGVSYNLGKNNVKDDGVGELFYSNGKIFVRDKANKRVYTLEEEYDLSMGLSFASLFPYYNVPLKADIYLPKKTLNDSTQLNTEESANVETEVISNGETKDEKSVEIEEDVKVSVIEKEEIKAEKSDNDFVGLNILEIKKQKGK